MARIKPSPKYAIKPNVVLNKNSVSVNVTYTYTYKPPLSDDLKAWLQFLNEIFYNNGLLIIENKPIIDTISVRLNRSYRGTDRLDIMLYSDVEHDHAFVAGKYGHWAKMFKLGSLGNPNYDPSKVVKKIMRHIRWVNFWHSILATLGAAWRGLWGPP